MNDNGSVIEKLKADINNIKMGSLKFWGEWFGRPMDNCYRITRIDFYGEENKLEFSFDAGEKLTVWNPLRIESSSSILTIRDAQKLRWEWFNCGKPQTCRNIYYIEYQKQDRIIHVIEGKVEPDYQIKRKIKNIGQYAFEIC